MLHVKDIMTTELVTVTPEVTLRDLVDLLAAEHLSGVPVVAGGKAVGVVTLDDIASFLASEPTVPTEGSPEIEWDEEPQPGEAEGEEAGAAFFLDYWADAGADVVERFVAERGPEWDLMGEHTVSEVMSRRLWTTGPQEPVEDAARRMTDAGIHRLLVVDRGRPCGIISTSDITGAVAARRV